MYLIKEKIKKIAIFISISLICAITLAIILFGINQFKTGSQLIGVQQISNLSHLLIRQQANLFSILLKNDATQEQLSEALEEFAKEEFVVDAALYASNGELLTQSENSIAVREHLGLNIDSKDNFRGSQQIVETIYSPDGILGFLRITFDNEYNQKMQYMLDQVFQRLYAEVIIVLLIGFLFASSMYYLGKNYRSTKVRENNSTNKQTTQKTLNSAAFHRRRKRFFK